MKIELSDEAPKVAIPCEIRGSEGRVGVYPRFGRQIGWNRNGWAVCVAAKDARLRGLPDLRPPEARLPEREARLRLLDAPQGDVSGTAVLGSLGFTGREVRSPGVSGRGQIIRPIRPTICLL